MRNSQNLSYAEFVKRREEGRYFISKELVRELKLATTDTSPYLVSLGDGQKKETKGCCKGVKVRIEDVEVTDRFHLFELEELM